MAESVGFLLSLGILSGVALAIGLFTARLRLPIITAEILAGMIAGPYVLGWVSTSDTAVIGDIATVGIVVLLFLIGLELDPVKFAKMIGRAGFLAVLEMGLTFLVGLVCAYVLRMSLAETLIFALASSVTSTAIVGQLILGRGTPDEALRLLMGMLVVEDVAAIAFLIVISSLPATGTVATQVGTISIAETIAGGFALLGLGFIVARYLAPPAINYLSSFEEEFEELPFLFALGLGFGFGVLGSYLGYSAGVGAFIIGLAIRGKHSRFLTVKVAPVRGLLVFIFFVYMGTEIDPFPALAVWGSLVLILTLLVAAKFFGGILVGKVLQMGNSFKETEPQLVGAWLVPRGEFSFIIGQTALASALITNSVFSILGITVLVTAIVGPLLQRLGERRPARIEHPIKAETGG